MSTSKKNIALYIGCCLFSVCVFAFYMYLWLSHPEYLSYQEQYQLFLFTGDYFRERMALPGGVADYLSEFIVQFYYVPMIGAACIAGFMTIIQILTAICCMHSFDSPKFAISAYVLSVIPAATVSHYMGDPNSLFSFTVAVCLTLIFIASTLKGGISKPWVFAGVMTMGFVLLYWCAGPVAVIYPLTVLILKRDVRCLPLWIVGAIGLSVIIVFVIGMIWLVQYPLSRLLQGINYYRPTEVYPPDLYIGAASVPVTATIVRLLDMLRHNKSFIKDNARADRFSQYSVINCCIVFLTVFMTWTYSGGFDKRISDVLRYDMLVRQEKWHEIITDAEKESPADDISLQAVNLALGKTGQLCERMFVFPQNGIESLISPYSYDNTTCLVSAETFWHLGMINSAYRYTFDLQEAIMNDRKSGRFCKRLAECLIINGKYKAARKFTDMLKHSLYYSDWAERAESYMGNEEKIATHPVWGEKRRIRFKKEMLYDYPEIEKMLGLLALDSEGRNLLAWDYFNAALMLKGDMQTLAGMYHYADETFHLPQIPRHVQEAIGMFWTFGHQNFEGIPYRISPEVQKEIALLARMVSAAKNNPASWHTTHPGTFYVYFLDNQLKAAQKQQSAEKGTMREG